jgi:hypothetical protein
VSVFDRFSGLLRSYLLDDDDDDEGYRQRGRASSYYGGQDFDEAVDELNEFLKKGEGRGGGGTGRAWADSAGTRRAGDWEDLHGGSQDSGNGSAGGKAGGDRMPPETLRQDFAELGVPFGADSDTCKAAYKKLLKVHHPDRHAGHAGNMKKATEKSARINTAFENINRWRLS